MGPIMTPSGRPGCWTPIVQEPLALERILEYREPPEKGKNQVLIEQVRGRVIVHRHLSPHLTYERSG